MSTIDPNNLGGRVSTRNFNWLDLARRAWGAEFNAPDHGIYEFSNGRKWDSTDKGLTGIYGVDVTTPLEFESNYPDMDASIQISDAAGTDKAIPIIFTENAPS